MQVLTSIVTTALVATLALSPGARGQKPIDVFDAQAVNLDAPAGAVTGPVQIQITRWSTDAERDQINNAIKERGADKLLDVVKDLEPVGRITTPGSIGFDLRYARRGVVGGPGGNEQIIVVTDRPMGFRERATKARSIDYPFTVIELRMKPNGEGEGKMSLATKVNLNTLTNSLELENYTISPITLQHVRRSKRD